MEHDILSLLEGKKLMCNVYVIKAQVWGGPRAMKHTKSPPEEEARLTTELP